MKTKLLMVLGAVLLASCGGGGGGGTTPLPDSNIASSSSAPAKVLQFGFAGAPLQPRVFNLKSTESTQDHWFYPGDTISLVWDVDLHYSDGSSIGATEKYTYQSQVYLSADDEIQEDLDLKLFEIECAVPSNSNYSCTDNASFQCVYADDNLNKFSCTSIPINKLYGITNVEVDSSNFIKQIPTKLNAVVKNCLIEKPDMCITKSMPLELN